MHSDSSRTTVWLHIASPLLMMALPLWLLGPFMPSTPPWVVAGVGGLMWSVWVGYAVLLVVLGSREASGQPKWCACVMTWLICALVYSGVMAASMYANGVLLPYSLGGAVLLGLVGLAAGFALILSPAVAMAQCRGAAESLRWSAVLMVSSWRRPIQVLVAIIAAVAGNLLVGWALSRSSAVPWSAAQKLVTSVLFCLFLLPAVGVVYRAVLTDGTSLRAFRPASLPFALRAATAIISPAMLAATCYFLLLNVVPVSLLALRVPVSPNTVVVSFFIPLAPARAALLLMPCLACGWLATSSASARWVAGVAGLVYGLLCTHISLGLVELDTWQHIPLYAVALCLYAVVGLIGGALCSYAAKRRARGASLSPPMRG